MIKILVVDDNEDLLEATATILRIKQFEVYTIIRWEDLQESIINFKPDLILMDISLAGADGRVLCKQLKSSDNTNKIPIVLFSAVSNMNIKETLHQCLADAFISKPFQMTELINTINTALIAV